MIKKILKCAQQKFALDKRTIVFDVKGAVRAGRISLTGTVLDAAVKARLIGFVKKSTGRDVVDRIDTLPDRLVGKETVGVITLSVANIHRSPALDAEIVNQGLLGTPVKILKKKGGWYFVQTPDRYLGWTDDMLVSMTPERYKQWCAKEKCMVTVAHGFTHRFPDTKSLVVSDIVAGNIIAVTGASGKYYHVEYPDGRTAYLEEGMAVPLGEWLKQTNDTSTSIVSMALRFIGVPYLWGGASPKALDCSGFVKLVFFLCGVQLPRDADQQAAAGKSVRVSERMTEVLPGDLLFFGRSRAQDGDHSITHVAISLGGKRFIQSSGNVHIGSLDHRDRDYNERRALSLIKVKRIIGADDAIGIRRLRDQAWFNGSPELW